MKTTVSHFPGTPWYNVTNGEKLYFMVYRYQSDKFLIVTTRTCPEYLADSLELFHETGVLPILNKALKIIDKIYQLNQL